MDHSENDLSTGRIPTRCLGFPWTSPEPSLYTMDSCQPSISLPFLFFLSFLFFSLPFTLFLFSPPFFTSSSSSSSSFLVISYPTREVSTLSHTLFREILFRSCTHSSRSLSNRLPNRLLIRDVDLMYVLSSYSLTCHCHIICPICPICLACFPPSLV